MNTTNKDVVELDEFEEFHKEANTWMEEHMTIIPSKEQEVELAIEAKGIFDLMDTLNMLMSLVKESKDKNYTADDFREFLTGIAEELGVAIKSSYNSLTEKEAFYKGVDPDEYKRVTQDMVKRYNLKNRVKEISTEDKLNSLPSHSTNVH